MGYIRALRDPTIDDFPYDFFWWNEKNNRFFIIVQITDEGFIWEQLKEK